MKEANKKKVLLSEDEKKTQDRRVVVRIISTVLLSVIVFAFYRFSLATNLFFPIVMWSYMGILSVLVFAYIIYNRGFSRHGVTEEMLPDEWTEEKKRDFVEDAKNRISKSKWMLVLIISFLVTFLFEALELFVLPMFSGWFE